MVANLRLPAFTDIIPTQQAPTDALGTTTLPGGGGGVEPTGARQRKLTCCLRDVAALGAARASELETALAGAGAPRLPPGPYLNEFAVRVRD